ncbi:MAG: prepilin-type N-terminal cleavage/methylation domain-containing protein [Nitrospirae bacterium]|nr:prepilin-type N-terminal cleavage/methylation domain-containing protein [Nitrospirota bacterium]
MKIEVKKMRSSEDEKRGGFLSSQFLNLSTSMSSGFTLLEVMIALAIISMTLMTVLHTVNYHANILNENALTTELTQLAKGKILDLETNIVSSTGKFEGTEYTYENTVSETDTPGIVELRTIVKGQGKEVMLNEFVLKKTE